MKLNIELGVAGRYKLIVSKDKARRHITEETGWFDNLITDNGLEILGTRSAGSAVITNNADNLFTQFYVGSGSTPPANGDTTLENLIASTTGNYSSGNVQSASSFSTGYASLILSKQFGEGVAAGNLSEIGIGPASNDLFSRALILDSGGSPTTITVQSNEFLTVFYELRWNIPQTDQIFSHDVTIDGSPVSHNIVLRASVANSSSVDNGWGFATTFTAGGSFIAYNGSLGSETSSPGGSSTGGLTLSGYRSYVAASHQRFAFRDLTISQGNLSGGISAIKFKAGPCFFQASFDPALAKDNTKTLSFDVGWSWVRV